MNRTERSAFRLLARICSTRPNSLFSPLCAAVFLGFVATGWAQSSSKGVIEGRVQNSTNGNYLNNARIALEGSNIETSTNEIGYYRLPNVPAGSANIRVTFEGMEPASAGVEVSAGQTAHHDFNLSLSSGEKDATVVLQAFTVREREMSGHAVAEQERRNAPNIKSVVSVDEFGDMGEGNVGEFLKYIPGVSTAFSGGQTPQSVAIRGMPSSGTIVMTDGTEMASSQNGTRTFDLQTSANGIVDRIEVSKVPTPDMPANAVGGTVNIINKSGFSRTTPLFSYEFFLTNNPAGSLRHINPSFSKRPGDSSHTTVAPTQPAFNLSYILPLNKKLAFTFTLSHAARDDEWLWLYAPWDRVALIETQNRPSFNINSVVTDLAAVSGEWKVSDNQSLRASFQSSSNDTYANRFQLLATAGAGATGGPTFTQGAATAVGNVAQQPIGALRTKKTLKHSILTYRYDGASWKVDSNLVYSRGGLDNSDTDNGFFNSVTTTLTGLRLRFDGIGALTQGKAAVITAVNAAGKPVDFTDGNNYNVTSVSSSPLTLEDEVRRAGVNVKHVFDTKIPFEIKVGAQINRQTKDSRGGAYSMTFTPPGGAAAQLARNWDFIADGWSERKSFVNANGDPFNVRWISPAKVYQLSQVHPEYFVYGTAQKAAQYTAAVNASKLLQETIQADYIRLDSKFFNNRLTLVGGVRYEHTGDRGEGPLNDISATYKKDANGKLLRDTAGKLIPITTDALLKAQLQFTDRGSHSSKHYDGFFPSLNAAFAATQNFVIRAGIAQTIGRPELTEIIPGITVTDPDSPATSKTITAINSDLKPWTANNYDLTFELYDIKGATTSVSLFRKDIKNFFGTTRTPATSDLLASFGLTDDYLGYDILTKQNFGSATLQGIEFGYRQSFDRFLPAALRGIQVFGNVTSLAVSGSNADDFSNLAPRTLTWGASYTRARLSLRMNVLQSKWVRGSPNAISATLPSGSYTYTAPETKIDVSAEYRFARWLSIYSSIRNINHSIKRTGTRGPGIPSYAQLDFYQFSNAMLTLGIKGEF